MNTQKGSAHVIIIVGLVILLGGAIGFIFWQNFIDNDSKANGGDMITAKKDISKKVVEKKITDADNIPVGYIAYKNESLGFSLAHPDEWGDLVATETKSSNTRMGVNGNNTSAYVGLNGGVRLAVYTKDSFFTKAASGYVVRYQGNKVTGTDAGSETFEVLNPISKTNVYEDLQGDSGFIAYNLFFEAGNSVIYVNIGDDKDAQTTVANTVKVF